MLTFVVVDDWAPVLFGLELEVGFGKLGFEADGFWEESWFELEVGFDVFDFGVVDDWIAACFELRVEVAFDVFVLAAVGVCGGSLFNPELDSGFCVFDLELVDVWDVVWLGALILAADCVFETSIELDLPLLAWAPEEIDELSVSESRISWETLWRFAGLPDIFSLI